MFARFRDIGFGPGETAGTQGEDADYVAGSRLAISESVDYGLEAIERGAEWFGSIPPAAIAQARRAARNGVSLDKVLLRTNAGHTVLEDFVMQEVDLASQRVVLRGVFATLGALLDHFTALMAHEYQREVERTAHSPELRSHGACAAAARGWEPRKRRARLPARRLAPRRDRDGLKRAGDRSSPGRGPRARAVERVSR